MLRLPTTCFTSGAVEVVLVGAGHALLTRLRSLVGAGGALRVCDRCAVVVDWWWVPVTTCASAARGSGGEVVVGAGNAIRV
jgi:hypothetical protein